MTPSKITTGALGTSAPVGEHVVEEVVVHRHRQRVDPGADGGDERVDGVAVVALREALPGGEAPGVELGGGEEEPVARHDRRGQSVELGQVPGDGGGGGALAHPDAAGSDPPGCSRSPAPGVTVRHQLGQRPEVDVGPVHAHRGER